MSPSQVQRQESIPLLQNYDRMRAFIFISALYFGYVSAQAQCFDAGDCILSVRCST